jgi:hypothetical protein
VGIDEIILAARYKQAHGWVPLDALDVPSVAGKNTLFPAFCNRPDAYSRVVAGSSEALVIRREAELTHGLTMGRPCGEISIVTLENGLKVERQAVPKP